MQYASAVAFRQALDQRLQNEANATGMGVVRLRKRVAFELFLRRLLFVAPNRWVLKGALALDFRFTGTTRATKDIDLGRDDDEQTAIQTSSPHNSSRSTTSLHSQPREPTS